MRISASHIANLFEYAPYTGVEETILRELLIEQKLDLCNPDNTVTEGEFLDIFEEILHLSLDKYLGLHYGYYLNIKALGFIAEISLNASSIQQAVFILQNYFQNTFPLVSLEVIEIAGKYVLNLKSQIQNQTLKQQVLDVTYCFLYRELTLMLPKNLLPQLVLPYTTNSEYSKYLNVEIKKGKCHAFIFQSDIVITQINKKRASEIEILLPKFLQMLDKKGGGQNPFSIQIRNVTLNMCCPELPNFEQVAAHFPLSSRTIQRKLTNEGSSFRKITDEIKNELSSYLSKGNKMKTQDIAYILGYAEPSAYLHAVKKWRNK